MLIIDGYTIDVTMQERHQMRSDVTSNPVEDGTEVTDHIRTLPAELELTGVVSDDPLSEIAALRTSDVLPSVEAFGVLRGIWLSRRPVTIQTSLGRYEQMALVDLQVPRGVPEGASLRFTARFKQIELVRSDRTIVFIEDQRVKKNRDRGTKTSPEVTPPNEEKVDDYRSVLKGIVGRF